MNIPKAMFRLFLGRRLAQTSGTVRTHGIAEKVLIRRDRYGIPHIEGGSGADAWFGLGFCQGQDRAFQIEGLCRLVRGTLSEVFGPATVPIDRLVRRMGFKRGMNSLLASLEEEPREILGSFVQGVREGARCGKKAHELALLRVPRRYAAARHDEAVPAAAPGGPFDETDVLALFRFQAFLLGSCFAEIARLKTLLEDGPGALEALNPSYLHWHPVILDPYRLAGRPAERLAEDLGIFASAAGHSGGSNNWAISPSLTGTGRPILANDPHLGGGLPPHWYLAHVKAPGFELAGASFAGAPIFPAGHNGRAAWGITAGCVDNTDFFIEETGPDGCSVREGDLFVPCGLVRETIGIRGKKPVIEEILITPRGPIVSPALEGEHGAISMSATWLETKPFRAFFRSFRARTFDEFKSAFEGMGGPSLNLVYADESGNIGWKLVGEAPRRRRGWGNIPLPGWLPDVGWEKDPVPYGEMPSLSNPPAGFVATANNRPLPEGEGPFLGMDWVDGYRYSRIVEALGSRGGWGMEDTRALQMDESSLPWRELRDTVLSAPPGPCRERASRARRVLAAWNGLVSADSPEAALFELFLFDMMRRITEAKAPKTTLWLLGKGFNRLVPYSGFTWARVGFTVRLMLERPQGWFERGWGEEIDDSLSSVLASLEERFGADPARWRWGKVRPLVLKHIFGSGALLGRVFNRGPYPVGGDTNTVNQTCVVPFDVTRTPVVIASLRMVIDVGNWDANSFALPGGQSGNPLSPHYDDLLPLWLRGEGVPVAWSPVAVSSAAAETLELVPVRT